MTSPISRLQVYAYNYVLGMQGQHPTILKTVTTPKHFMGQLFEGDGSDPWGNGTTVNRQSNDTRYPLFFIHILARSFSFFFPPWLVLVLTNLPRGCEHHTAPVRAVVLVPYRPHTRRVPCSFLFVFPVRLFQKMAMFESRKCRVRIFISLLVLEVAPCR